MNILAFDTATAACSVAIRRRDGALFDYRPVTARMFEQPAHATELLPAIVGLLERAELDWSDLGRIAVGVGPGAFTGLRIGVASARAIATARSLPLTPVSSLAALAAGAGDTAGVLPVIDARRGEFFHRLPAAVGCTAGDAVSGPDELVERVATMARVAGSPLLAVGDGAVKLREPLAAAGVVVPDAGDPRHVVSAAAIISLAETLESLRPDAVVPNYIRAPDAKISSRERWLVTTPR